MDFIFAVNILALLFSLFVAGVLLGVLFSETVRKKVAEIRQKIFRKLHLERHPANPILRPGTSPWTAEATFNPAAAVINGRTHLIYRAIGTDGVSRLGYASSPDGYLFDERLPYPVYVSQKPSGAPAHLRRYSPVMYPSGGSWGGCEDPRMVTIEGRIYMTYNAFDGWNFIRVACVSIDEEDLLEKRFWKWRPMHLLSPEGQIHKNWVIFPEKIRGKFAILHSIVPKVEIEYRDSIDAIGTTEPYIKSWEGPRQCAAGPEDNWDNVIRGAGPPPIKTDKGWLLFYHATRATERHLYKLGAMLLDLEDPTRVLYRAATPILSPDARYENEGKPGIVYACGAVVLNRTLFIYYGGADKVVCVATAPLAEFLDALIEGNRPLLDTTAAQTFNSY
ncbi:hypothetical protein HYV30_00655 [Candidatus Kaiserbacteria bacterium]|nr:hypothetical protein [Candidatus Kaiserbacteria bacterium]